MSSRFGQLFTAQTFGESHGPAVGVVVDGVPAGVPFEAARVQAALDRRRPGQSALVSPRREADRVEILSGVFEGVTLGSPVAMLVRNEDADPSAYLPLKGLFRPSHADFTTEARFGRRDWRGGGRSSARETVGRVAAGALAEAVLDAVCPVEIVGWVDALAGDAAAVDAGRVSRVAVDAHPTRCPDPAAALRFEAEIRAARAAGDTVGGVVAVVARGLPAGLGEPVFDKLEADLGKALLSLPACKGVESGSGFAGARMRGSAHNDAFAPAPGGGVTTRTNHSGGIQGGLSNGMPVLLRAAFKPVATIFQPQDTVDAAGAAAVVAPKGRHDPCVLPRAVPMVEAMVALVLCDHVLRARGLAPVDGRGLQLPGRR
jgi:chorismate synthase